ncbi:MAG TPA: ABC transporter substrate-binding protein [Burkholderiales bacterium]|nr:ABC transporter substrate-binding protein [Burkholderiales bacterium]
MARLALIASLLVSSCVTADVVPYDVVRDLAPAGKLRAAINFGNPVLAQKDPASGQARGVSVDLAREVARRADVPLELVPYDAAGKVTGDATSNRWDIAFVGREPERATDIEFTAPYVIIEGGYLVPANSRFQTIEDVDREGVRIAVSRRSAYDLFLSRGYLKRATLIRAPTPPASMEQFAADHLEAVAGVKAALAQFAATHPGYRVLPGRFMVIEQAMALPRGRPLAARYLREFIDEMKASGFVATSLEKSGQKDAAVAP